MRGIKNLVSDLGTETKDISTTTSYNHRDCQLPTTKMG